MKSLQKGFVVSALLVVIAALIMGGIVYYNKSNKKTMTDSASVSDNVFFEKKESWGPCPVSAHCQRNTSLYESGTLLIEIGTTTVEKKVSLTTVDTIIKKITDSGLMIKECPPSEVMDYSKIYRITLSGKTKEITFPGCEKELDEIDSLLPI